MLTLDDVDSLVATGGLRYPSLRIVREGESVPRSAYLTNHTTGGQRVPDAIDGAAAIRAFGEGATLVLQALHRFVPSVQSYCRALETFFGHPVQANAYLTPPGAHGLGVHHDTHDVLVLQLFGHKRWSLFAPTVAHPVPGYPSSKTYADPGEPERRLHLKAGDCLYLPRGIPHQARGEETASLHLTLGVRSPTWHELLERLLKQARELPELRAPLPLGYALADAATSRGDFEDQIRHVLSLATGWLSARDPHTVAQAEIDRAVSAQAPWQPGRLLSLAHAHTVAPSTVLHRASEVQWRVATEGQHAYVRAGKVRLRLPARIAPALQRVAELDTVNAASLAAHLDEAGSVVLLSRLHREGLLRILSETIIDALPDSQQSE